MGVDRTPEPMKKLVAIFALAAALLFLWHASSGREDPSGRLRHEAEEASAASAFGTLDAAPAAGAPATEATDLVASATVIVHVIDEQDVPVASVKVGEEETDAQGVCRLSLPPGKGRPSLPVLHPAYAPAYLRLPVLVPGARKELWVRLLRGVTVEGRVLVEGTDEPAAGARIQLSFSSGWYPLGAQEQREARVAADGSVRWEQVPAGRVAISVLPPHFEDAAGSVFFEVVPPRRPEPFVLHVVRTSLVVVRFISEQGAPITEGMASYVMEGGTSGAASFDDGVFEEPLRAGAAMRIEAMDNQGRRRGTLVVRGNGSRRIERDLILEASSSHAGSGTVRLFVSSARTGRPLSGARISYTFRAGTVGTSVEEAVGARGSLAVTGLPIGPTDFTASAPDHKAARVVVTVERDRTVDATVSLEPALAIRGRVEYGAGANVLLRDVSGKRRSVIAAEDGGFAFEGLDAGSFRVEARVADGRRSAPVDPVAAGRHDVVLTLLAAPPRGTLELRCKDSAGRAVFQIALRLQREGGSEKTERVSDPRGIHRIVDLEPGRYSARIWALRYTEAAVPTFEVAAGETTTLDIDLGTPVRMLDIAVRDVAGRPVQTCVIALFRERDGDPVAVTPAWVFGGVSLFTHSDGRYRQPLPTEEPLVAILSDVGDFKTAPAFARRRIASSRERSASVSFVVDRRLKVIAVEEGDTVFRAGFREGDIIERWNDSAPRAEGDIPTLLREPAAVTVLRGEKRIVLRIPASFFDLVVDEVLSAP